MTSEKRFEKLIAKFNYKSSNVISQDVIGVEMRKKEVILNKPIAVGFCILDLSKLHMYKFHYDTIKTRYGDKATLLMTDTDSLVYNIKTEDMYIDLEEIKDQLDTSEYPEDHPLYSTKNAKVIGKFKDELNGKTMDEFVGLRSKLYSYQVGGKNVKKAKGISKSSVNSLLNHDMYKKCVLEESYNKSVNVTGIRSSNHVLYTLSGNKRALCSFDDKRYILDDGIRTLAYGHYKIRDMK